MSDVLVRMLAIAVLLVAASAAWWLLERRRGALRPGGRRALTLDGVRAATGEALVPGAVATIVQLSSEVCTPCRRAARTWSGISAEHRGISFVELDAARHLDLTRDLGVLRTPTALVFDADGNGVGRVSGPPTPGQARDIVRSLRPVGGPS